MVLSLSCCAAVKSVDFAEGCDRFSAVVSSIAVRVLRSNATVSEGSRADFFRKHIVRYWRPTFPLWKNRAHPCANSTLSTVTPLGPRGMPSREKVAKQKSRLQPQSVPPSSPGCPGGIEGCVCSRCDGSRYARQAPNIISLVLLLLSRTLFLFWGCIFMAIKTEYVWRENQKGNTRFLVQSWVLITTPPPV